MRRKKPRRTTTRLRDPSGDAERIAYRHRLEAFVASRDAAASLSRGILAEGVTADALIATAATSATFADEALAIVNEDYRPTIACREGCSYCCCKPGVLVTIPEVLRILAHVRETIDPRRLAELKARAARYVAQLHGRHFNDPVSDSIPCPLLVEGRCSVYDIRPLVCRGFNSASAEACRNAHGTADRVIPMFAILKDVTDGITIGIAQQFKHAGLPGVVVDLGTALHIALERDSIVDAVVRGDRPFEAAEDESWADSLWSRVCEVARQVGIHF
jgi:Fe-S-cluster containining protein